MTNHTGSFDDGLSALRLALDRWRYAAAIAATRRALSAG